MAGEAFIGPGKLKRPGLDCEKLASRSGKALSKLVPKPVTSFVALSIGVVAGWSRQPS
jgi:hypothetical protein